MHGISSRKASVGRTGKEPFRNNSAKKIRMGFMVGDGKGVGGGARENQKSKQRAPVIRKQERKSKTGHIARL